MSLSCFAAFRGALVLLLLLFSMLTTQAIDDDHPLRQYLKSMHRVAGRDTWKTPDEQARAVKDFRKRFEQHRLALLEQEREKVEEGLVAEE